jgi:glutamate carboxypeptidase
LCSNQTSDGAAAAFTAERALTERQAGARALCYAKGEVAMNLAEPSVRWLEDKLPKMEEALAALVEVNSFTDNVEGGRKVGAMLREVFAIEGLTSEVVPSQRYADHLVFRSSGNGRAPLALVGHLDTVFPPGKFEGYRVDGALRRGPGVLDMKGGLVVIAWALKALAANGGLSSLPPLRLVVVSDEEVGSPEGQGVIRNAIGGASACLVFESGRQADAIITRRKGTGAITAVAKGKAAHAGNAHHEGANAIWAIARWIDRAQALTDYEKGVTVNVGKVTGGQGKNTVPDHVEALADIRFCTRADGERLFGELQRAAEKAGESVAGTKVELSGGIAREPLERSDASLALMSSYGACAKAHGLGHAEAPLVGGGSDASTSSSMGIPSIDGLGPRGKGFHTVDEFIEVSTLIPKAQALARFLSSQA